MSAGMAGTIILGGKRKSCEFLHRKCVDILADRNGFSRFSAADNGNNAGLHPDLSDLHTVFRQFFADELRCLIFLVAEFRMSMNMPANGNHFIFILCCETHCIHIGVPLSNLFIKF